MPPPSNTSFEIDEKGLTKLVEMITTTGRPTLDEHLLKQIKKACKSNDGLIKVLDESVFKQLQKPHSEIRLSAFQLLVEIFERSHLYRTMVLEKLHKVFDLTLETNNTPLPKPKEAAKKLRVLAAESFHKWTKKYGLTYKKLEHGYNFLRHVKNTSFNDVEGRSQIERQREQERKLKMDNIWRERVKKVKAEIEESQQDLEECATQIENCLELLMPNPDNFLHDQDANKAKQNDDGDEDELQDHGICNAKTKISIELKKNSSAGVEVNDDNRAVIENLRDQHILLTHKLSPMVKKWSVTLTKAGEIGDQNVLKRVIDIKTRLDSIEDKAKPLKHLLQTSRKKDSQDSSDDDDDFIEVEEKEGYEETVRAEDHAMGINFYSSPRPSTSAAVTTSKTKPTATATTSSSPQKEVLDHWTIRDAEEDERDPTTMAATLAKLKSQKNVVVIEEQKKSDKKEGASDGIVTRQFDTDLIGWEDERKPQKVSVPVDNLRFWSGGTSARDDDMIEVPGSDSRQRVIEFAGKFEEVKWACRAPLPSGKLCPRKDRFKCPFHGKIIARNEVGEPVREEDKQTASTSSAKNEPDDWQDPKLLEDIKATTGLDLKVQKKGKGRGKRSKESELTNIKEVENTSRRRLEKIVFNKGSLKRVASAMNKIDMKKSKDKFGDQFNYMYDT